MNSNFIFYFLVLCWGYGVVFDISEGVILVRFLKYLFGFNIFCWLLFFYIL